MTSKQFVKNIYYQMSSFATTLKELRKSKGLSQEDLAEKLGVKSGKQTVSNWELSKTEPTLSDIRKIAEILETTVGHLVDGVVPSASEPTPKPGYITVPMEEYIDLQRIAIQNLKDGQSKPS